MTVTKKKTNQTMSSTYIRYGKLPINAVMEAISKHYETYPKKDKEFSKRHFVLGYELKLDSLRLNTFFNKGVVCSCCGLKASYFAVESHRSSQRLDPPHLNLWGINDHGEEILFTHDHTLARSLGGNNNATNTTTMCTVCNGEKSVGERILKERLLNNV